ncbi:MAG TPA: 30S ribosomal protein S20 [Planctomycetota bacterium]|nr:30S ribosomal protein S20 [Planctomycetota bacterium]
MAHTLSGAHNIRKNETRRLRNKAAKSALRTQIRKVLGAVGKKDKKLAETEYRAAAGLLDKAARKGIIHANSAARHKSRLAARVAAIA